MQIDHRNTEVRLVWWARIALRVLPFVAVLAMIGIMTAIHQGTGALIDWIDDPSFVKGLGIGAAGMAAWLLFLNWLESRSRRRDGRTE
jgi:hypothetical protein